MALIECPACNQSVSDNLRVCPHCGFELFNITSLRETIIGFFIIFLVFGYLMGKYTSLPMPFGISFIFSLIMSIYGHNKRATPKQ